MVFMGNFSDFQNIFYKTRMLSVLLILSMVIGSFNHAGGTLDPGEQAQVSTAMDTTAFFLKETADYYSEMAEASKEASKAAKVANQAGKAQQFLIKQNKALSMARKVGKVLQGLGAASAVAGFVFTFFMPSELSVITDLVNKRFDEVNLKLDAITEQLTTMTTEIKSSVEFNNFLTSYRTWENAILNTEAKLREIKKAMSNTKNQKVLLNLANDFIKYYDNAGVHGKMLNIYRAAVLSPSATHKNFFDSFIKEYGCDVTKLTDLYLLLRGLLTCVAEQTLTYYQFKGMPKQVDTSFQDAYKYMYDIRNAFDESVLKCKKETLSYPYRAENDAKKIINNNKGATNEDLAKLIFNKFAQTYPWYTWSVIVLDKINEATEYNMKVVRELETKGHSYLKIAEYGEKKKNVLIVWQDTAMRPSCLGRQRSNTVVFYTCDKCTNDRLQSGDHIISKDSCHGTIFKEADPLKYIHYTKTNDIFFQVRITNFNKFMAKWKWIASSDPTSNPCNKNNYCGSYGYCNAIPSTGQAQCLCQRFYEGDRCQTHITLGNKVDKLIADLRKTYAVVAGVPTVVDIFFQVRDVSSTIDKMLGTIKTHHQFGNALTKHSRILHQSSYIANKYSQLQTDEIRRDEFSRDLDNFFQTASFDYISSRLREILLGESFTDTEGSDFVNIYKKYYSSNVNDRCTSSYANQVTSMINELAALDQAISEAYLEYIKWKIERANTNDAKILQGKADRMGKNSVQRQKDYWNYWKRTSCPALTTSDMLNRYCTEISSFMDMSVPVKCGNSKRPTVGTVICRRQVSGVLSWSSAPRCEYYWSNWGGWSACSRNCGGGIRRRYRTCVGHPSYRCSGSNVQSQSCGTESCCQAKYGKFRCSNGRCIPSSWVCDGTNDCGNYDDETKYRCPNHIYSGDWVALKNNGHSNQWLSCYCTVNCGWGNCRLTGCPGQDMTGGEWRSCISETFRIFGSGRGSNQPIRSNDVIALRYAARPSEGDWGRWLSCWGSGSKCTTRACPGLNFDFGSEFSNCRGEIFWIYTLTPRKPLKRGDTVYIQYSYSNGKGYWLSGSGANSDVRTRTCPGKTITSDDSGCRWESWKIYRW